VIKSLASLTFLLFVLSALSIAVLEYQLTTPVDTSPIAPANDRENAELLSSYSATSSELALSGSDLTDIINRPLFTRDRQKFTPPPPPKRVVEKPKPPRRTPDRVVAREKEAETTFVLLGLSVGDGKSRAFIASKNEPGSWLQSGDRLQSWIIEDVNRNGVRLSRRNEKMELLLYPEIGQ